ncbi:NlpC/P60 family protein [Corallococcus llansteffanensis]|uniref:Peptidoglycan-binding protein n=1 Tax=Corallococcus llansteffanensis TaxID=2316731 RepID=A0A3A8QJF3_9BACT|nr:peptidoglycan-binding protein [Corallococcus llansteffanensis]RKH66465.1 hypothetical protein D7V93_04345 [Corallococcus llansteffanensis]
MSIQEIPGSEPSREMKGDPILQEGSRGPAVVELQQLLTKAGFSVGSADGVFGAKTKAAVVAFQRSHQLVADGIVGARTWAELRAPVVVASGLRAKIVSEANWGITNAAGIHYQQVRPIDGLNARHQLPLNIDCSGFVTLCYKWAGAPDPNGLDYNGQGYTGTLLSYLTPVSSSQIKPGDLVLWHRGGAGEHVSLVLEPGSDPLLVSHGAESGPYTVRFSASNRSHAGASVAWLILPSVDAARARPMPEAPQSRQAREKQATGRTDPATEEVLMPEPGSSPVRH